MDECLYGQPISIQTYAQGQLDNRSEGNVNCEEQGSDLIIDRQSSIKYGLIRQHFHFHTSSIKK